MYHRTTVCYFMINMKSMFFCGRVVVVNGRRSRAILPIDVCSGRVGVAATENA